MNVVGIPVIVSGMLIGAVLTTLMLRLPSFFNLCLLAVGCLMVYLGVTQGLDGLQVSVQRYVFDLISRRELLLGAMLGCALAFWATSRSLGGRKSKSR